MHYAMEVLEQLDTVAKYTETVDAVTALTVGWVDAVFTPVRLLRDTYGRSDAEHYLYIELPVSADHLNVLRKLYEKTKDWLERTKTNEQN